MASRLQIIIEGVDKASGPIDDVTGSLGRLEKGSGSLLERGLNPLRDMLGHGLKAAALGAAGAVGGLVAGIGVSTKAAMGMEQGVADIASVMRLTKDETSEVKDLITDLGVDPSLKVSATEAASAIEMLGKNGLALDDILGGAARSTVLLANATGADFATSADVATDAMALFGLGANQMEKAVAGIVGVTQSSKFGLEEYKFALANAAPVLATMGVSFDEFNAALTLSASSFASGMTAGTSWRYMIQNLVPGTDKAAQLMKELNFIAEDGTNIFFDSTGQLKSLDEIINLLKYGFRDLSTEQRTSYARAIFGQEALGALNAALEMNVETLADLVKNQSDVNSLNKSAETRMNTLAGAWEILEGIIEALSIQIGEHFLPIWRDLVGRFTDFLDEHGPQIVEWAGNLAEGLGELIDTYLPPFIAKLGEWWTAAGNIADTAGGMLTWTGGLLAWLREAIQPAVDFVREYVSLEDVLRGIGIVISAIVIPWLGGLISAWGPVFLVLAGAIGAVSLLRNAWEGDWGGIQGIVAGVLNYLGERFGLLLTAIQVFGPGALQEIWAFVTGNETSFENLSQLWRAVRITAQALFLDLVGYVRDNWPTWKQKLGEWGSAAWQWLADTVPVVLAKLGEWGGALWGWLADNLPTWLSTLGGWATAAWQWLGDVIPVVLTKLGEWGGALWGWLTDNWPTWSAKLGEWASAAWQWIADTVPVVLAKLGEWGAAVWGWLTDNWPTWSAKLGEWGAAAWQWIEETTPVVVEKLSEWGTAVYGWLSDNLPGWVAAIHPWGMALFQWIADNIPAAIDKLTEWVAEMFDWSEREGDSEVRRMLLELGAAMLEALGEIGISLAKLALTVAGNLLLSLAEGLLDWLGIDANMGQMRDHLSGLLEGLQETLSGKAALIGGVLLTVLTPGLGGLVTKITLTVLPALARLVLALGAPILGALGKLVLALGAPILGALGGLATAIWTTVLPAIGAFIAALGPILLPIALVVAAVAGLYLAWQTNFLGIRDYTKQILDEVKEWFTNFPEKLTELGNSLRTKGEWALGKLKEGFEATKNGVRNAFDSVVDWVARGRDEKLPPFQQSLYNAGKTVIDKMGEGFNAVKENAKTTLGDVLQNVRDHGFAYTVGKTSAQFAGKLYDGAKDALKNLAKGFTDQETTLKTDFGKVLGALRTLFDNVMGDNPGGFLRHVGSVAKTIGTNIMNSLSDGIAQTDAGLGFIIDKFNGFMDEFGPHAWEKVLELGGGIVRGLAQGIRDAFQALQDALDWIASIAPQWVKEKLGIHSPSRVFIGIGEEIMRGMALGIEELSSLPQMAMAGAVAGTVAGATSNTSIDNSRTNNFNITLPTTGQAGRTDQQAMSLVNTLTAVYA